MELIEEEIEREICDLRDQEPFRCWSESSVSSQADHQLRGGQVETDKWPLVLARPSGQAVSGVRRGRVSFDGSRQIVNRKIKINKKIHKFSGKLRQTSGRLHSRGAVDRRPITVGGGGGYLLMGKGKSQKKNHKKSESASSNCRRNRNRERTRRQS